MKLLIITQKVDKDDPILGFFHNWILEFSKKFKKVSVICLEKGKSDLPGEIKVFSLGKEAGRSKIKYIKNFFNLILGLHKEYDAVLVHMNQEYVLMGGFIWKLMGKRVFLWRNHPTGNFFTRVAVALSNKVFCTSEFSFVAKYKKTEIMPVGIDTERFKLRAESSESRERKNKILFLSRISPIKKPDLLIEALGILNIKNINFEANFYGDPLLKDEGYYNSLKDRIKELGLDKKVNFYKSVPNYEAPKIYSEHEIFVNLTPTGSFDKTILEAAVCGCVVVIANKSLKGEIDGKMIIDEETPQSVAQKIELWLNTTHDEKLAYSKTLQEYVLKNHSLNALMERLVKKIN